ncbi:MAG: endonuclease domain-containing protein [Bacteroidota bacterium]|nr:endonuclease domain-containing protein [Bacteroidota bacterium]
MRYLPYNKELKNYSRDLRNHSTLGEVLLWKKLRARGMMGYQFYRQKPIENYIVDFYCPALKMIIEIDGAYHVNNVDVVKDEMRETKLKEWNLAFLRFKELEVRKEINAVLLIIENYIIQFQIDNPDAIEKNKRKINPPSPL